MYTEEQLDAICRAQDVLREVGLQSTDILASSLCTSFFPNDSITYTPSKARLLTRNKPQNGKGNLTRQSSIHAIADHPLNAILEFPESGHEMGIAIGHRFRINPKEAENRKTFVGPQANIQYSMLGLSGHDVQCLLLEDEITGEPVLCRQTRLKCRSIKKCSFNAAGTQQTPSTSTSLDAPGEVFMKTLGFYCALRESGCYFDGKSAADDDSEDDDLPGETTLAVTDSTVDLISVLKDSRSSRINKKTKCAGSLHLEKDRYGHYFIRCEYYAKGQRNHLRILNVNEYNIEYLEALFGNKKDRIRTFETAAAEGGYGPLVLCGFTATAREQKELCPVWHRDSEGKLTRGTMIPADECPCEFEIFQPENPHRCPYILIVSQNPHSHSNPLRTKTPGTTKKIFYSLLEPLGWRLADATPRRLLLDNTFIYGLRQILNWIDIRDPGFGDLHPSLNNYDHTARLIDDLRHKRYPEGTGLEGAKDLLKTHALLEPEERYIRSVETYSDRKEGTYYIVICMFKAMSHLLLKTTRPTIDTSFKRLHKWQEFEIEAWFPEYSRSVVVARAFTTSQSAVAHQSLFRDLFKIVKEDTEKAVQFRHIHGNGIETITADGHRGQALGLGLYCQEICATLTKEWSAEWNKPLNELTSTDHLACIYRYCLAHYVRNINNLRGHIKENVRSAMMSLAGSDTLPNYTQVKRIIRTGGKKASDWLKDKENHDAFMLAAIYRPLSKIPVDIWKAAPSTSNGNEQAHRNINRDGIKLTMLAGIMRGLQFDSRAMRNVDSWLAECIPPRDRLATHFRRSTRAIQVKANTQKKIVSKKDTEIQNLYDKTVDQQKSIVSTATTVKRILECSGDATRAQKRLRQCDKQLSETRSQLEKLLPQSSSLISINIDEIPKPETLYDPRLLESQIKEENKPPAVQVGPSPSSSAQAGPPPSAQAGPTFSRVEPPLAAHLGRFPAANIGPLPAVQPGPFAPALTLAYGETHAMYAPTTTPGQTQWHAPMAILPPISFLGQVGTSQPSFPPPNYPQPPPGYYFPRHPGFQQFPMGYRSSTHPYHPNFQYPVDQRSHSHSQNPAYHRPTSYYKPN